MFSSRGWNGWHLLHGRLCGISWCCFMDDLDFTWMLFSFPCIPTTWEHLERSKAILFIIKMHRYTSHNFRYNYIILNQEYMGIYIQDSCYEWNITSYTNKPDRLKIYPQVYIETRTIFLLFYLLNEIQVFAICKVVKWTLQSRMALLIIQA